jgi:hypothetical protein
MIKMNISLDNDVLQQFQMALARFGKRSMPGVSAAVGRSASVIRDIWRGFAMGGSLPGISENLKNPGGGYARSIKIDRKGPFDYEVYSDARVAGWIENGTDELDMKTTHPFGPRSRMGKSGYPYLIVPFRWGTPGTKRNPRVGFRNVMPEEIYNIVKNKAKFRQTATTVSADNSGFKTPNAKGDMVGRARYSDITKKKPWGDTLTAGDIEGSKPWGVALTPDKEEAMSNNMAGMSRMLGQNGRSAGYLTFRVISAAPGTTGWIKPAMKARPVTRAVAAMAREPVNRAIDEAIREDLGL